MVSFLNYETKEENQMYLFLIYGMNAKKWSIRSSAMERTKKTEYISSSTMKRTKKNECICSSTMKQTKKNECIRSPTIDVY